MANLQKLNPTQQELYNYLEQQTGQVNFEVLQPFTTQEMGTVLHISRNTVSQSGLPMPSLSKKRGVM